MCLRINRRNTTSAGVPCRPRLLLLGWRLPRASYTAPTSASSASQSSRRSPTSAAIRPSPKLRCARRISIMFFAPGFCRIRAQQVMIEFTNGLDRLLQLLITGQRAANRGNALAPHAELSRASTGIGHRQNEDVMASAARAFWAALGMPDGALQQRAAQQLASDRQFADEFFALAK